MDRVESIRKPDQNLTIHLVRGLITAEKIIDVAVSHHENNPSLHVLWDFSASEFSKITGDDIRIFIQRAKKFEHLRPGGKTALVFFRQADFGMGRMVEILSEIENLKIRFKPFYDLDEALTWLNGHDI
jgi:hypothetical protein